MKSYKLIFLLLLVCLLTACGTGTKATKVSNNFIGTWQLEKVTIDDEKQDSSKMNLSYTFNDDGVVLQTNDGEITAGTYTADGGNATLTFTSGNYAAKISNNQLTMDQSGCVYTFKKAND